VNSTTTATARDAAPSYLGSFLTLGLTMSLAGSALTHLQHQTGSSIGQISRLFLASSIGYISASVLAGRAYDRRGGHALLAGAFLGLTALLVCVPVVHSLLVMCLVFFGLGSVGAIIDVGGNTLLLWSRGDRVGPMMNALHFTFGVGALICPVIVKLSLDQHDNLWLYSLVSGGCCLAAAAWVIASPSAPEPRRTERIVPGDAESAQGGAAPHVLATIAFFFTLYVGLEIGFGGWIKKYAEESPALARTATALLVCFWAAFTAGRLLAIPVAKLLSAGQLLAGATALAAGASVILVVADGGAVGTWIATVLFGIGVAPQFPMMMAYAGNRIPPTDSATAWFIGGAGIGGLVLPYALGPLFDSFGPRVLPVTVLTSALVVLAWLLVVRRTLNKIAPLRAT
jgi:MFS transporter, FHS family, Na+ dependent glucose transporter 1